MSLLITGGAGYIGSHTAVELLNVGYELVILDDFSNSTPKTLDRIRKITGKDFTFYPLNLLDAEKLATVFEKEPIEAVIHFAGFKAVGESVQIPLTYYQNNLTSTLNLLTAMKNYRVHSLVFSSSATVYGTTHPVPFTEDMSLSSNSPYGRSKVFTEKILEDIAAVSPQFSAVSLRYFNPIGAHPSGKLGEAPTGKPHNLIPCISQVATGKRTHLQIFGQDYDTPDGTNVRDYIHVVDVARGHLSALEYARKHSGAHAFNLGTGRGYSVLEVLHTFERVNKVDIPYTIEARRPGDIATSFADPSKAEQVLGWKAKYSLEDMCRSAWKWKNENPYGYHLN